MGDISQFATRPHRGDAEGCARAFAHVLEIIVAFAITCTDGGGEQWLESDSAMVSPRAAVACEPWRRFAPVHVHRFGVESLTSSAGCCLGASIFESHH